MSSSCVPCSMTAPLDITAMMSAVWIVDSRWAMTMQVRPFLASSRAAWTVCGKPELCQKPAISYIKEYPTLYLCCLYLFTLCIQGRGSFIQQQDLGVSDNGPGDGNALLLSSWQLRALSTNLRLVFLKILWRKQKVTWSATLETCSTTINSFLLLQN